MRVLAGSADRGPVVSSAVVLGSLALLCATVFTGTKPLETAPVIAIVIVFAVAYRSLLAWTSLLAFLIAVIAFIPMQRYVLPGSLPFELEPYRLIVALVAAGWLASLLADPRVRLRRSGFDAPILLLAVGTFGSVLANGGQVSAYEEDVAKALSFFLSFLLVFYLVVSVVRTREHVDFLLAVLVGCGAVVAGLAIIESRTEFNAFDRLSDYLPLLEPASLVSAENQEGRGLRAYASAQHPIALGAALVLLIPPAIYLVKRTGQRRWWIAGTLLVLGALATLSRTSVIMLLVVGVVFFWLRRAEVKRILPFLLPVIIAVHVVIPGTIGTLKQSFFPEGGLIAEQSKNAGSRGSGRVADIGPALGEFAEKPLFGQGVGTRRVEYNRQNAQILDNQWLSTLLETGLAGAVGWLWLMWRSVRRLARAAKEEDGADGMLFVALAASVATLAIGMLTFDAFAFIQVMMMFFLLLALGSAALARRESAQESAG
jgi:hypothetical protein